MSYQPYPSGGSFQPYPAGGNQLIQRPPQPQTVQNAVRLMFGGAAISFLSAILVLVFSSRIKTALGKALVTANATLRSEGKAPLTASQMHSFETAYIGVFVVILLIAAGLWVWMAWANGRGKNWARIVSSVLLGLNTVYLFFTVSRGGITTIFVGLGWLLGVGAIVLLWQRQSSAYFKPGGM
jgi:hypothetical protein